MLLKVSCALESPGVLGKIAHLIHRDPAVLTPGGKESENDSLSVVSYSLRPRGL